MKEALWGARDKNFASEAEVDAYLDELPLGAHSSYKANTSCIQIVAPGEDVVLCDAGTGIRDFALSLGGKPEPATYHIFVSHLHWDHIQGLPFFTPAYAPGNRIVFHGAHEELENTLRMQMKPPVFPVDFDAFQADIEFDIRSGEAAFEIGNLSVRSIRQDHPGTSWGYRFEHSGKSIVYSSDSEHGPEANKPDYRFINFFKDADVLIFDGQYSFSEALTAKRNWGHSNHITAVELAARSQAKHLIIFHHEPAHSDTALEEFLGKSLQYREVYGRGLQGNTPGSILYPRHISLAYDGMIVEA